MLRDVAVFHSIHNTILKSITERHKGVIYGQKSLSVIVLQQVCYIFKEDDRRTLVLYYTCYFEEQIASGVIKAFLPSG